MILICKKCHTRYMLPGQAIGAEGRFVRCSKCKHEWFQEPPNEDDEDDLAGDSGGYDDEPLSYHDPDDVEPIPESVRPLPDDSDVPAPFMAQADHQDQDQNKILDHAPAFVGTAAGALVIGFVTLILLFLSGPVSRVFPATAGIYEFLGIHVEVPGESLIFDQLAAVSRVDSDGLQILSIDGKIINLQRESVKVPYIRAVLRGPEGEVADSWLIDPPVATLEGESETVFSTLYPEISPDIKTVQLYLTWPEQ